MKTETKVIDELTFEVTQLTGWKSLKMMRRLGAALGPALGAAMGELAGDLNITSLKALGDKDVSILVGALSEALPKLFENITETELEGIARGLLESVVVHQGDEVVPVLPLFDNLFGGRSGVALKLLVAVVGVNYSDFLGDLAAFVPRRKTAGSSKDSQPTS